MKRVLPLACGVALLGTFFPTARAADDAQELRQLRALMERQSKQLDVLAEEVVRLRRLLDAKNEAAAAGEGGVSPPAASPTPAAASAAPAAAGSPAKVEFSTDTPKAEPPDGRRHVVVKGETLTSIAKHYNITIAELKKANKEMDERKLQIGQTLAIPAGKNAEPPAKAGDTATKEPAAEKKENP